MICIIALAVFSILAIFSVSYRPLAKESFDCVFRRITLRKCTTGLDTRLKSTIVGRIMKTSPKTAKITYKYFEVFSWLLVLLMIGSLFYSAYGLYNYAAHGNCNGEQATTFCVYDTAGRIKSSLFSKCQPNTEQNAKQNEP